MLNIKEIVRDNTVSFLLLRQNVAYYKVVVNNKQYMFPVSIEDIGEASLLNTDKAIFFMRYIRKALEAGTFVEL